MIVQLDPQPGPGDLPARFPSPFATEPHPLAARAVRELVAALPGLAIGHDLAADGKMFGVLVVAAPDGRIGYVRAFSGMVGGRWQVPGFVPPVFDDRARDAFWPAGEAELAALASKRAALDVDPAHAALAAMLAEHGRVSAEMHARHAARREARHVTRARVTDRAVLHALDDESRRDGGDRRRLDVAHRDQVRELAARVRELAAAIAEIDRVRAARSRELLAAIHDTYAIPNARGELRHLRDLFGADAPPGGAGDCAAPKLLAHAYRTGLRPIALAEVWCGAPPITGGRHAGVCYPACRGKCGPILAHMLDGLDAEPAPIFGVAEVGADEPRVVFEDEWLTIVAKPVGLLSVPGRSGQLRDSVATRLRARYPDATGPLVVHRLDLDTSGLLLVAKHAATHTALQRLFARREIDKRYVAWLDGNVAGERGTVELPLRVDIDDRPRQIVDRAYGNDAVTDWRVVARSAGRTRVELVPRTGRTHQLRVHAAHPLGLGAPVVGDRLYGRGGDRLLLHAEAIGFVHPHTGERIAVELPAPF